jgi:hypothetical protein
VRQRPGIGDSLMGPMGVVELLELAQGVQQVLLVPDPPHPDQQAAILAANLAAVADELKTGALASIARGRVRIRSLPILGAE